LTPRNAARHRRGRPRARPPSSCSGLSHSITITPGRVLDRAFDVERRFAAFPSSYAMKGMFFPPLVDLLGDGWSRLAPALRRAPTDGRYTAFRDYPQEDYSRLAYAVAQRLYGDVPVPEGARRVARSDFARFASSRLGRVMLPLLDGADAALLGLPRLYRLVVTGGTVATERIRGGGVRVEYRDWLGWVDCYPAGTIEGICEHYGCRPRIELEVLGDDHAVYEVRL
jgi:uncharacterized protein (TIGR02265 family)